MINYFRWNTSRYIKRKNYIVAITLLPLLLFSVITVMILLINFRIFLLSGFLISMFLIVSGAVFLGTVICWFVIDKTDKAIKRNRHYSFFDIGTHELVFSKYAGEYIKSGERTVLRKLYIIPLGSLDYIGINKKKGNLLLTSDSSGIRFYKGKSERLNYHYIGEKLNFENWWFNENGFENISEVVLPNFFGTDEKSVMEFYNSIAEAKKRFSMLPKPKPYVHKEIDFVKRKKLLRTFNNLNKLN